MNCEKSLDKKRLTDLRHFFINVLCEYSSILTSLPTTLCSGWDREQNKRWKGRHVRCVRQTKKQKLEDFYQSLSLKRHSMSIISTQPPVRDEQSWHRLRLVFFPVPTFHIKITRFLAHSVSIIFYFNNILFSNKRTWRVEWGVAIDRGFWGNLRLGMSKGKEKENEICLSTV